MTRLPFPSLVLLLASGTAHAVSWVADSAASTLAFAGTYEGDPFHGKFARFTPAIAFDGSDPATIRIGVDVDVASVDSGNEDRDGTLRTPDFLWWEKYPKARFETQACRAGAGPNRWVCTATLTIREKTKTIEFPFAWTAHADGTATLDAKVTIDRMDYDVGTGDWADDVLLAHAIDVTTTLKLKRVP